MIPPQRRRSEPPQASNQHMEIYGRVQLSGVGQQGGEIPDDRGGQFHVSMGVVPRTRHPEIDTGDLTHVFSRMHPAPVVPISRHPQRGGCIPSLAPG